ncbi:MAG: VWA domain-containing protein [Candidatus Solibacter sp.]
MARGTRSWAGIAILCFSPGGFAWQIAVTGPLEPIRPHTLPQPASRPTLRVDSSLVLIPVHVTAASGSPVVGLKKEDFALFQDGVPQTITHFTQDDAAVSAGVLLDISGSMKNKLGRASAAAEAFFQSASPQDEFFLVEFNGRAKLKIPFTRDWSRITAEIAHAKASGFTAMLDAVQLAAEQMKHARNSRKALIILSDGGDNFSRRNLRQLRSTLIESDLQVYVLGVYDQDYSVRHSAEERRGPGLLDEVALDTGGREFPVASIDALPGIGRQLSRELRNQYVLGYSPNAMAADGKYHHVKLTLIPKDQGPLHTYYRRGYYAPQE